MLEKVKFTFQITGYSSLTFEVVAFGIRRPTSVICFPSPAVLQANSQV